MSARRTVAALALVAVVGAVLALYYWVHKPLTPTQALAFAQTIGNLFVALVLVAAGGGLGRRLLRAWLGAGPGREWAGAGGVIEITLGWGALGLGLLLLGALRLYYPAVVWLLAAALLVWLRRDIRLWLLAVSGAARGLMPLGRLERVAAGFTLLALGLGLLRALAPPLMWDALVYHLTLPALYVRTHGVQVTPAEFSLFSGMPQLTEMLYTAASLLRVDATNGAIAAQVLGWCFGVALCLGLAGNARALGLPAWLAPAILLSSVSVALELGWAYADWLLMLCAWAMVLALRQWRAQRDDPRGARRWLALAGVCAGLAAGCKYTGMIVPLAGVAVVILNEMLAVPNPWRGRVGRALLAAALFAFAAGAAFAPWMLKNGLLAGSPFYPLLWPAADMDALRQWFYNRPDLAAPYWQALTIFFRATFLGVQGGNDLDATLGPLLLLCARLLLVTWRGLNRALQQELAWLLVFEAAAYGGWVFLARYSALGHQARLFFAAMPALALLGAAGLAGVASLNAPTLRLSMIVNAAVALVLGLTAIELAAGFVAQNPLPYLTGTQSAADYDTAQLGWYAPALEGVNQLPAGSRVEFLWEARSLACDPAIRCVPDVVIDRWWHARRTLGSAEQILAAWRAEGAAYVLINDTGARFVQSSPDNVYAAEDWSELDKLRGELRQVAAFGNAYTLYGLP